MAEVRDLYLAAALTNGTAGRARYLVWVGVIALYFVTCYPFQGVLYTWCGAYPQQTFVILGALSAFALSGLPRAGGVQYRKARMVAVGALGLTMLLTLAAYQNLTVVRELVLLAAVTTAVGVMSSGDVDVARGFVYVSVVLLIPAFIATTIFYTRLIDWSTWAVEHLNLADTNPLRSRQLVADFDYYLPLWSAVVPQAPAAEQGFGLNFIRQSFIFTEPSDLWYFVAGPFWIAVADTRMPARNFCLVVLGTALALSFSVFGILVTAAALVFAGSMAFGGPIMTAGMGALILAALPFVPVYDWISLIGSNKADELSFYTQNVTVLSDLTWLGHVASVKEQPLSYGFLTVLYRYGMVGFGVNLCIAAAVLWGAFRILQDQATLGRRRYPLFIGCFVSVALLVKGTAIVPSMAALCFGAAVGLREAWTTDPLRLRRP